jgi:hypothetical protein
MINPSSGWADGAALEAGETQNRREDFPTNEFHMTDLPHWIYFGNPNFSEDCEVAAM